MMKENNIPTGKLSRSLKTGRIAAKAGLGHIAYLSKKPFTSDKASHRKEYESELGKMLFKGLSQMRGTALKVSQVLSAETEILPAGIQEELGKSCYRVPPINRAQVRKVFLQEFDKSAKEVFASFDASAFAAASLGQVHKATSQCGKELAVKVQYPGISESIDSDLKILSMLFSSLSATTSYMPNSELVETILDEIRTRLKEEVDYEKEAQNTQWFYDNLNLVNVKIPKVYTELSSKRVISFEFLQGKHIDDWLKGEPSQEQRNKVGQTIFNIFLYSFFELNVLHADPHLGNFLIQDSGKVCLLDFGCVKRLEKSFPDKMANLFSSLLNNDIEKTISNYVDIELFSSEITVDEYLNFIQPALAPMQQWFSNPFTHEYYDFSKLTIPPRGNTQDHKKSVKYYYKIQRDQVYFDRTLMGVFQLLKRLKATIHMDNPWIYS